MTNATSSIRAMCAGFVPPPAGITDDDDSVRTFLRRIAGTPLLTAEQESRLFRRIDAAGQAGQVLEVKALREAVTLANLRLVVAVAKRYRHRGVPVADLIQEGVLGLMKAVERFDHSRQLRFSTYAVWWIRQAIVRAVAAGGRTVRLPEHVLRILHAVTVARRALTEELGRAPSTVELAVRVGIPAARLERLLRSAEATASLDEPHAGDLTLADFLLDGAPDPEAHAADADRRRVLAAALGSLAPRERRVLALRYGFDGGEGRTIDAVAERLGLTRKQVRYVEQRSLRRLRMRARRLGLSRAA